MIKIHVSDIFPMLHSTGDGAAGFTATVGLNSFKHVMLITGHINSTVQETGNF